MMAFVKLPPLPTRGEIAQEILRLLSGDNSRDQVADWAQKWIIDDGTGIEYPVPDSAAWEMLKLLAAADFKDSPDSYFYDRVDFEDWLTEIKPSSTNPSSQ